MLRKINKQLKQKKIQEIVPLLGVSPLNILVPLETSLRSMGVCEKFFKIVQF